MKLEQVYHENKRGQNDEHARHVSPKDGDNVAPRGGL